MLFRLLISTSLVFVVSADRSLADAYSDCLITEIHSAKNSDTVEAVKKRCEQADTELVSTKDVVNPEAFGLVSSRLKLEESVGNDQFSLLPHKASYILPITYNDKPNNEPFALENGESDLDNYELKFQVSFKTELLDTFFPGNNGLFFAYTNQTYWQHLDSENSGPVREINHEPELFFDLERDLEFGNWKLPLMRIGWAHQSNGRSSGLSRSWNRLYGQALLEKTNWAISLRPWIVVNGVTAEEDSEGIDQFMGNFDLNIFRQGEYSSASILLRNNLRSENRGAIEINWSRPFPYSRKVRLLLQYFYGYGESLIDFDKLTNRVGIGLQLSDWL